MRHGCQYLATAAGMRCAGNKGGGVCGLSSCCHLPPVLRLPTPGVRLRQVSSANGPNGGNAGRHHRCRVAGQTAVSGLPSNGKQGMAVLHRAEVVGAANAVHSRQGQHGLARRWTAWRFRGAASAASARMGSRNIPRSTELTDYHEISFIGRLYTVIYSATN